MRATGGNRVRRHRLMDSTRKHRFRNVEGEPNRGLGDMIWVLENDLPKLQEERTTGATAAAGCHSEAMKSSRKHEFRDIVRAAIRRIGTLLRML